MIISQTELTIPNVQNVIVSENALTVELEDGRSVAAPLGWYPRLAHASPEERVRWRLIGAGIGIHWEDLDEDISVEALILGKPSGESQKSFQRWLAGRSDKN